jgi:hypothetical protein
MKQAPAPILTELTKLHLKESVNHYAILTQAAPFHGSKIEEFTSNSIPAIYHGLKNVYLIATDNLDESRVRYFAFENLKDLINAVLQAQ